MVSINDIGVAEDVGSKVTHGPHQTKCFQLRNTVIPFVLV